MNNYITNSRLEYNNQTTMLMYSLLDKQITLNQYQQQYRNLERERILDHKALIEDTVDSLNKSLLEQIVEIN